MMRLDVKRGFILAYNVRIKANAFMRSKIEVYI